MEYISIKDLKKNQNNPRIVKDTSFQKLKDSLRDEEGRKHFEARPVIVSTRTGENIIIAGNTRYQAAKDLGWQEIPTVIIPNLTEEREREIIIRDNVANGEWDMDTLYNEWDVSELTEWGLDLPEVTTLEEEAEEDDFEMPDEVTTDIVKGDLIEIGEHRLLCGDSTMIDEVGKLMNGRKADMVFTDPPYLMDFAGGVHADGTKSFNAKHGKIRNDKMGKEAGDDFLDAINANIRLVVEGAFYICFYRLKLGKYFESLKRTGLEVRSLITWNKGNHTLSNSDYMSKCEHIFYGWVRTHNFYGGKNGVDVWDIPRTKKNELRPTMKPIPLCEKAINDASKVNDVVLDLFLGSGSTMVASHQLKRKCYGMELDPKYCQVIVDRMRKLDPNLVIKRNGEVYE